MFIAKHFKKNINGLFGNSLSNFFIKSILKYTCTLKKFEKVKKDEKKKVKF